MPEEVLHDPALAWRLWWWCGVWLAILAVAGIAQCAGRRRE